MNADARDRKPPYTHALNVTEAGHEVRLVFHVRNFMRRDHVVKGVGDALTIDGRGPLGTDGEIPHAEIWKIDFTFDGKSVSVPKSLFSDCFEPHFFEDRFAARLSDDKNGVFVFMQGSDGAGSYEVIWVLRRDGNHSRWSGSCGDCSLLDIKYFKQSGAAPPN